MAEIGNWSKSSPNWINLANATGCFKTGSATDCAELQKTFCVGGAGGVDLGGGKSQRFQGPVPQLCQIPPIPPSASKLWCHIATDRASVLDECGCDRSVLGTLIRWATQPAPLFGLISNINAKSRLKLSFIYFHADCRIGHIQTMNIFKDTYVKFSVFGIRFTPCDKAIPYVCRTLTDDVEPGDEPEKCYPIDDPWAVQVCDRCVTALRSHSL